jgi:hypothetical protein
VQLDPARLPPGAVIPVEIDGHLPTLRVGEGHGRISLEPS